MRKCTICGHSALPQINEQLLIDAEPLRNIAKQNNVSLSSLHRHRHKCLPADLVKAKKFKEVMAAENLISQLMNLVKDAKRITKKSEDGEDFKTALAGVREQSRVVEIFLKMNGLLGEKNSAVVNNEANFTHFDVRAILTDPELKSAAKDLMSERAMVK